MGCSASSAMPSVVLPEPDSPTMPSVSPRRSCSVAWRTASNWRLRNQPCGIGNGHVHVARVQQHRRVVGHRLHHALRPAGQQALGVGVLRLGEDLRGVADLHQLAALHHADAVGEAAHQVQVVGDEQQRHAHLALQLVQQRQDLRLDGHVQRGGRLVADQQLRRAGQRHRDHRALALAAGELVRIGVDLGLGVGDAGAVQQLDGARARGVGPQRLVQRQHLDDLVAHGVQRVQRRHRLLEDHADARAADAAHLALALSHQVLAVEADRAAAARPHRPGAAPTAR